MRKLRKKPGWYIIVILAVCIGGYGVAAFGQSMYRVWRLTRMFQTEQQALDEALERIDALELEIDRLTNDLSYIEKIAREEFGMVKEGEEVFHITSPKTDTGGK